MATDRSTDDAHRSVSRKADHLRINLTEDVSAKGVSSGLRRFRFVHQALPETDLDAIDTRTSLFGRPLGAPILISSMTGGTTEAGRINRVLAETAQTWGLALGLGSGRVLLERPEVLSTFAVRHVAPDIPILANLGAIQLNHGIGAEDCRRLVDVLSADSLVLHLNPLQEALQPGGNTDFSDLLSAIEQLCLQLEVPVVVKEVGWGLAADTVRLLLDAGVAGVDIAGAGGTSWSEVERYRMNDPVRAQVAAAFAGWGIPTADALIAARSAAPDAVILASGGIADGIDIATCLALGADLVGLAGPFLRAAASGQASANEFAQSLIETIRTVMFAIGETTLSGLRYTPRLEEVAGS